MPSQSTSNHSARPTLPLVHAYLTTMPKPPIAHEAQQRVSSVAHALPRRHPAHHHGTLTNTQLVQHLPQQTLPVKPAAHVNKSTSRQAAAAMAVSEQATLTQYLHDLIAAQVQVPHFLLSHPLHCDIVLTLCMNGDVRDIQIKHSSGISYLDHLALQATQGISPVNISHFKLEKNETFVVSMVFAK